ncbi:gag/pol protein [Cucumis melo var. makuwa]|uniref:Gag/pol protein n=1 Tax=Cucumis melo var. makuwa TaxID=1194695 RepID=A0A5A7TXY5_CUCMM|nr:gag/pol protein [Cucumis melo var. makuwa]
MAVSSMTQIGEGSGSKCSTTEKEFIGGLSSKTKVRPSQRKKNGKGKAPKNSKGKKVAKDKCYHCNHDEHWLRNYPKYVTQKKAEKEALSKYDLLAVETCLVEYDTST